MVLDSYYVVKEKICILYYTSRRSRQTPEILEEPVWLPAPACIRIPMLPEIRSLNLSNSVVIVLYEALRQQGFESMQRDGELHRLHWKES